MIIVIFPVICKTGQRVHNRNAGSVAYSVKAGDTCTARNRIGQLQLHCSVSIPAAYFFRKNKKTSIRTLKCPFNLISQIYIECYY